MPILFTDGRVKRECAHYGNRFGPAFRINGIAGRGAERRPRRRREEQRDMFGGGREGR